MYIPRLGEGPPGRIAETFRDARLPLWSEDGHSILFSACREAQPPMPACSEWWVMSTDGTLLQNTHVMALLSQYQNVPWEGAMNASYNNRLLVSGTQRVHT